MRIELCVRVFIVVVIVDKVINGHKTLIRLGYVRLG